MNKYAVYVSDDNGWADQCPSFKDVFFGYGVDYVHPVDGSPYYEGHVVVTGYSAAIAMRGDYNESGDWENPSTGKIERPKYAIQKLIKEPYANRT